MARSIACAMRKFQRAAKDSPAESVPAITAAEEQATSVDGTPSALHLSMTAITRILVPTDFSESADQAFMYALALADGVGAAVRLVHVFEDPDDVGLYSNMYVPMPVELREQILTDLRRQLSERVATMAGSKKVAAEVVIGAPARTIVEDATAHQCDLIVMGTHGRHGMAHMLLGSVAERVIRTAACPVLVVRPQAK